MIEPVTAVAHVAQQHTLGAAAVAIGCLAAGMALAGSLAPQMGTGMTRSARAVGLAAALMAVAAWVSQPLGQPTRSPVIEKPVPTAR